MFWDKWIKRDNETVLNFVKESLFPPLQRQIEDGTEFFVDYSIDANLEAIICDIQDGTADEKTITNLNYVIDRLHLVRKQYNIYPEIKSHGKTTFYMVSCNTK